MSWERPGLTPHLHTGPQGDPGWRCWQELGSSGNIVKLCLISGFLWLEPDSVTWFLRRPWGSACFR